MEALQDDNEDKTEEGGMQYVGGFVAQLEDAEKGREIWLAYEGKVGEALPMACDYNEALIVAKAAKILKRQVLEHETEFDETLIVDIRGESEPPSLLEFVSALQNSGDIKSQLKYESLSTDSGSAQLCTPTVRRL
ncbi:uncharacterized protein [Macrobrachium rosenbergii]|uniref:uncharacterized protein n=1 Tax=Macrobrachium rosenbergii TaxID=79674 RepID=UPI0034D4A759